MGEFFRIYCMVFLEQFKRQLLYFFSNNYLPPIFNKFLPSYVITTSLIFFNHQHGY